MESVYPITAMGYDGFFYHYESSCCESPSPHPHIGFMTSMNPIDPLGCGGTAPPPDFYFDDEPPPPPPLPPCAAAVDDAETRVFHRASYRGFKGTHDPDLAPTLMPMKDDRGRPYLVKIAAFPNKWFLVFRKRSAADINRTVYLAREYRGQEDNAHFGNDYNRVNRASQTNKLIRSRQRTSGDAGPLHRGELQFDDLLDPWGDPLAGDFHIALTEGW